MYKDTFNCAFPFKLVHVYFPLISCSLVFYDSQCSNSYGHMHITVLFKTAKLLRIKNFVDFVSFRTQLQ